MEFNSISIEQFLSRGLISVHSYGNDLIVTNRVEALDPFKRPCRLDAITVFVCVGGRITCTINLKEYTARRGDVLVVFSGDVICITRADDVDAYAILISEPYLSALNIDFANRTDTYLHVRRRALYHVSEAMLKMVQPYYPLFRDTIGLEVPERDEALKGLVRAYCYTVIALINSTMADTIEGGEETRSQQIFDKFIGELKTWHTRERSVKFYADRLGLSPKYLSFAVKDYSGKGALDWINEYVLLEAKMMLQNTDISIKEIAYSLNFLTQSAFGKYFKQQTGIGPKAYRANI